MKTRRRFAIPLGAAAALFLLAITHAADGDLDLTFSGDGKVMTDLGTIDDQGAAVAIQPGDGRILVAGWTLSAGTDYDFALARYNVDGSPDVSFGSGGTVATDFANGADRAHAMAIQADGKIVVAGAVNNTGIGTSDFGVARYDTAGNLDASFGGGGRVITNLAGSEDVGLALAIQDDGRILVAGTATNGIQPNLQDFAVVRYNANGSLDATFGSNGVVLTDIEGENDYVEDLAIQADGKIIAAGYEGGAGGTNVDLVDFALARYNPDGSLDASFDGDGKLTTDFANRGDRAHAVGIQSNGAIVAGGFTTAGTELAFALVRYNAADGSIDTSFGAGGSGKVRTNVGSGDDRGRALAILPDDRLVLGGFSIDSATSADFALARYTPNGALDPTFSGDGIVTTDFGGDLDSAEGVAVQSDGKLVAAGWTRAGAGQDFALARYEGPPAQTLTFYLHGHDIPGTAGGFTMNQDAPPYQTLGLNLGLHPSWFTQPTLTGTFQAGATFKLTLHSFQPTFVPRRFRLAVTAPDGSAEQEVGQIIQLIGINSQTVTIPVATPLTLTEQRLKLTISPTGGLVLLMRIGDGTFLEASKFVGTLKGGS